MNTLRFASLAALLALAPAASLHAEAPAGDAGPGADGKAKKPALARLLKSADANSDQKLDLAEIHAKLPNFPAERFTALDKNQDGFLEAGEMPAPPKTEAAGEGRGAVGAKLKAADTDQDGKLSQAEFTAAFPNAPAERFARLDQNSDGFVDRSDRAALEGAAGDKKKDEAGKKKAEGGKKKAGGPPADAVTYVKGLIARHDADKDGKLTKAELEAAKPGFPEKNFTEMDRDKDGVISEADLPAPAI
ncbi:MAG: EF-hand domain-containing protein [Candidatus Hydrogenedentes bacterium]|nr:EF-hand domain-containing protein [Candidatus Hydrogenedentota bacterium]